jgi:hypothetical protein
MGVPMGSFRGITVHTNGMPFDRRIPNVALLCASLMAHKVVYHGMAHFEERRFLERISTGETRSMRIPKRLARVIFVIFSQGNDDDLQRLTLEHNKSGATRNFACGACPYEGLTPLCSFLRWEGNAGNKMLELPVLDESDNSDEGSEEEECDSDDKNDFEEEGVDTDGCLEEEETMI